MLSSSRSFIGKTRNSSFAPGPALGRRSALALLIGGMFCAPAQAALSDTIHPFASLGYSYEDNLLRLPDGVAGPDGRSDTLTQAQVGLQFDRPVGRQDFSGQLSVTRVSFDRYSQLDYNGKDFSGQWSWQTVYNLSGHIGGAYSQTLTPFTDYHSSELDLRTTRRKFADINWLFHPSWQVHGAYTQEVNNYDLDAQRYNDRTLDTTELGVDYLASTGSRFGVVARSLKGSYPNQLVLNNLLLDDGYRQDELKANIYWLTSSVTQLQVVAGWARRRHDTASYRDSSGPNGRVTAFWTPTGQLSFNIAAWREFAVVESTLIDSSLNKGESLNGTWAISYKIKADASIRREKRDFSAIGLVSLPGGNDDQTRRASAGLTYTPLTSIQLNLSGYHETRTGNVYIGTNSYKANGASFTITGQF